MVKGLKKKKRQMVNGEQNSKYVFVLKNTPALMRKD